jgi:glycosyltransferase involved in cell wall biosynthesis
MRITHYLHHVHLSDGGVCRAVLDFCTWQARAGASVTLASVDPRDVPSAWRTPAPGQPSLITLPSRGRLRSLFDSAQSRAVESFLRETDVLHLHDMWDPAQVSMARLARRLNVPYVQSPHGMMADWSVKQKWLKKKIFWSLFTRELVDHAAFIVLTAQGELDQSRKRHPKTPGVSIPLVFDTDPYLAAPTPDLARANLRLPSTDDASFFYLSRLHYKKRPDLLLAAARLVRDAGHRFNIVFAGPSDAAYDAQLKNYAKELEIDDITTFLGMVPAEWKPSLFSAMDVFVLPTSMENFGFVYFEALACATPVLTTKGTDTWPDILASGGGRIVELIRSDVKEGGVGGGDVRELAGAMIELLGKRSELKGMGRQARAWVLENMNPSRVTQRYLEMYQQAIDRARGTART